MVTRWHTTSDIRRVRMSCSQNHRTVESLSRIRFNARHLVVLDEQGIHACLEVYLSATG